MSTEEDTYTTSLQIKEKGKTFELEPESKVFSETLEKQIEKPVFVTKLSPAIISVGNTAKFTVTVSGFPKPFVQWYHNGQTITSSSVYTFIQEHAEHTLVINDVKKELEGEYSCTASNRHGKSTCTSFLHVKVKDPKKVKEPSGQPPYFTKAIESLCCQAGDSIVFEYKVTGDPLPSIEWFKDSYHLQPSKYFSIVGNVDGSGFIKIMDIQQSDSGLYSCKASNLLGEASCSAELIVYLDTVSVSQKQEKVIEQKQKAYKVSVYGKVTESRLYSTASLQEGSQVVFTTGAEDSQIVADEHVGTLCELDVSSAAIHEEQITQQTAVLQSHETQERVAVAPTQPQPAVATPLKQLHMAAMTSAVQERQGLTEQHCDRIKSPEVLELQLTEEQPSKVMSAISESVTPLTVVKAEPITSMEGETIHAVPEPKLAISSHQIETKLAILKEECKNIPFPEKEKPFRIKEGIKILQSTITSENLQLAEAHSSSLPTLECSECIVGREQPEPVLISVSAVQCTFSKEGGFDIQKTDEEVAQPSKDQMLKSALVISEKHELHADETTAIVGLDSAVSVHSHREEDQVLHLQVVSDQDTLSSEGRFANEKPQIEHAESRKGPLLLHTGSMYEQTAVSCEHLAHISSKESTESVQPEKEAPAKLHLQSVQSKTTLFKEGLLPAQEPDKQMAMQRQERAHMHAVIAEEKRELMADYSKYLDVSVTGFKPEHRKEPKPLSILHSVSLPMQLPKESPFTLSVKEQRALVQKEDCWNIMHAVSVSDTSDLEEGHTDNLKTTEKVACKLNLEPKLPVQPLQIEEKAISTESCVALEAAEQDSAVQIKEGQSLRQAVLKEEKQTLTSEVSQDIIKPETTLINFTIQPPKPLLLTESQESQALPKELTFVIEIPKSHSLDIKHQLKNALQCAVACDQPLILADVVRSLEVVEVKEVKTLKEPTHTMFSYLIMTTSIPVEITVTFKGEYPQTADLRSELQATLNAVIYQGQEVLTSEQLDALPLLRHQRIQHSMAPIKEMLSAVTETENVEVFTPPKSQSAALKTETKDSLQYITGKRQIVVQESKSQKIAEGKLDIQKSTVTVKQEMKSVSVQSYERDIGLAGITSCVPMTSVPTEESTGGLFQKERLEEFLTEDITTQRTPEKAFSKEPLFEKALENIAVVEDSMVTFTARIKHAINISWFFNGKLIESGKEFKCSKDHDTYTLVIHKVKKEKHEGGYTCEALNEVGKASTSSRLTVVSRGCIMGMFCHPNLDI